MVRVVFSGSGPAFRTFMLCNVNMAKGQAERPSGQWDNYHMYTIVGLVQGSLVSRHLGVACAGSRGASPAIDKGANG